VLANFPILIIPIKAISNGICIASLFGRFRHVTMKKHATIMDELLSN
jgi:DNA-directed RNA polymerase subunit N (RpoN/RPB10)